MTWKHIGAGSSRSALKLLRWNKKLDKAVDVLQLGEFEGASNDYKTTAFEFQYSSDKFFWQPAEKGLQCHRVLLSNEGFLVLWLFSYEYTNNIIR